jgi:hypothetical protein
MTHYRRVALACFGIMVLFLGPCGCSRRDKSAGPDSSPPPDANTKGDGKSNGPVPSIGFIVPARPALPKGWIEFRHPEGAYTIYTPGRPMPDFDTRPGSLFKPGPGNVPRSAHFVGGPITCMMEVNIYPAEEVEIVRAELLRIWEQNLNTMPGKKGSPIRRTITWGGRPADELEIEREYPDARKGGTATMRTRWVGRNLCIGTMSYSFTLIGNEDGRPTAAERAAFFDSFVPGK